MKSHLKLAILSQVLLVSVLAGCASVPASQPTDTPTPIGPPTPTVAMTASELKYRLLEDFDLFFCDPDFFPVGRPGVEEQRAREMFPEIMQDTQLFEAIASHLSLDERASYTEEEQLAVYREYKKLNVLQLNPQGDNFSFEIRTGEAPEGFKITGTINRRGQITIQSKEQSFNTCPICLSQGTLIDTPGGSIPVDQLVTGIEVWTVTASGERVVALIEKAGNSAAPEGHQMVHFVLTDGRSLNASPGHPLADGRLMEDLAPGDSVDGALISFVERLPYEGRTYDILPGGDTGMYWANGMLVSSTLD